MDALSFRDLWVMFAAANEREQAQWQHTLTICTMIGNVHGAFGRRGKPLDHLWQEAFGKPKAFRKIDREELSRVLADVRRRNAQTIAFNPNAHDNRIKSQD